MAGFLTEVEGFTPVIDAIVQDVGLMQAIVYGVVWRYCQMPNGVCIASLEQIANRVGISRKTAERHIKALCKSGYLRDATPRVNNKPQIYADTGKTKIKGLLAARSDKESDLGKTESLTGRTESLTPSDRESYPGKTESPTKRVSEESIQETLKENRAPPAANAHPSKPKQKRKPSPKQQEARAMFSALADVCQIDLNTLVNKQRDSLNQSEKRLRKADATPADMEPFATWWYANDWRGKKGDAPRPAQVRETWGQFKAWREGGQQSSGPQPHAGIRQWLTEQGIEAQ